MKLSQYKHGQADKAYCIAARFFGGTVLSAIICYAMVTNQFYIPSMFIGAATLALLWFMCFYFFWAEELTCQARDEEWLEKRNEEYQNKNTIA